MTDKPACMCDELDYRDCEIDCEAPNTHECPECGAVQEDFDGFGFLFCEACKYCRHPSQDGDGKGNWVCGLCGRVEPVLEMDKYSPAE